jgi:hypothetical protein
MIIPTLSNGSLSHMSTTPPPQYDLLNQWRELEEGNPCPFWIYVFGLGYSNLWSSLCCECILRIVKKLAGGIIWLLWTIKIKES